MEITLGTGNEHKVFEINTIVKSQGYENITFVAVEGDFDPTEDGSTFEENSLIKAREGARLSGNITLADDSGLCIDALNGAPGLYSARYAGTQDEKIARILRELDGKENRKAKFVCCMTLVDKEGNVIHTTRGECHGHIIKERKGTNGFGYDPVFMPDGYDITLAEMSEGGKNKISHRGRALTEMLKFINEKL
ncbi:MAG: RdgB/HAM1 family non-canonical purine NTP pyrophosphatase [Cyanobacteria bacterium RUI128]|nr:RdgB/HAM1 family non-canonical purine NTP pyrophosphatase [Cyanobacteria bacterium RUI128]